jgi:uncharacterized membrane protein
MPESARARRRLVSARIGFILSGVYVAAGLALIALAVAWYANGARIAFILVGVAFLVLAAVRVDIARRQRRTASQQRNSQAGT